mmetsp:Transcript_318/g.373  ORF Transcript_318/g.373 Transcript_318/m.373 type:complete len:82 (-) Transcript_318:259-504(-)
MASTMMENLVENAKFVSAAEKGTNKCETECKVQQDAIVTCMNSIREQMENGSNSDDKEVTSCLSPVVAAWTECCSKANETG